MADRLSRRFADEDGEDDREVAEQKAKTAVRKYKPGASQRKLTDANGNEYHGRRRLSEATAAIADDDLREEEKKGAMVAGKPRRRGPCRGLRREAVRRVALRGVGWAYPAALDPRTTA